MLNHFQVKVKNGSIHAVEVGASHKQVLVFLHGWPENWRSFEKILNFAGRQYRSIAIDIPGIGGSVFENPPAIKHEIADIINELLSHLGIDKVAMIGHDVGGQITYSFLKKYPDKLSCAVIMNVVIPGINPWNQVIMNPYIWHFRFHSIKGLPETLVSGKERDYFNYFYEAITAHPEKIENNARNDYAIAYSSLTALKTGFEWYRTFSTDAKNNESNHDRIEVPLLYIRGNKESGNIADYLSGFQEAGIVNVKGEIINDSGHFSPEEQPEAVFDKIQKFIE